MLNCTGIILKRLLPYAKYYVSVTEALGQTDCMYRLQPLNITPSTDSYIFVNQFCQIDEKRLIVYHTGW